MRAAGRAARRVTCLALAAALGLPLVGCALLRGEPPPAWELPPPPVPEAPVVEPGRLHGYQLDNGLEVRVLEDRRLPRVVMGLAFRRGEAIVAPERAGLAPFTAELLKRGAGELDAIELAGAVDRLGASLSVGADWDSLTIQVTGLSRDQERLLAILADVALRPRFSREEAERARSETLASLERGKDDPSTLAGWYASRAVYEGHRFGLPLAGAPETVAGLDAEQARAFYEAVVIPNNGIFFASGDVEPEALLHEVAAAFGSWQPAELPEVGPAPPDPAPPARRILVVDRPELVQAQIALSHDGIRRSDPDRIAAMLMNSVLGGGSFSSRLMARVRSEAGLTYGVWSGFSMRRQPGPFTVATFTRVPETRRVIDMLLAELARIRDEPPDEEELGDARTLAVGRFGLSLETSAAVMSGLVDLDVYGLPEDSLDTYRARVRAVGVGDTARERLHPDGAAIVVVGPASELVPQLEDLGPIETFVP